jgi:hypothetical protein
MEANDLMRMADIKAGWAVVGNDGHHVCTVREATQNYLLTDTGGLTGELYVPASAIANVEHQMVHLAYPQADVAQMGWGQAPRVEDSPSASPEADLHRHV